MTAKPPSEAEQSEVYSKAFVDRFWAKVKVGSPEECWPWLAATASNGYGRAYVVRTGRPAGQVAWEIANGAPFPVGKYACHTCDNPICVNPVHIWPGTQAENIRDCVEKGRYKKPIKTHCKRGHLLNEENRLKTSGAWTRCHTCQREFSRQSIARKRAAGRMSNG